MIMDFSKPESDLFVPDNLPVADALGRTTHLGIGAHQDDLEFFAIHGILECFARDDRWFTGVTVTNGAGSARTGPYERFTDEGMMAVRKQEQRKAATIGEYAAMVQLGYSSAEITDAGNEAPVEDIRLLLEAARAETVYLHSPADKHDTHIAVLSRCIQAIRLLPVGERPGKVYGCEIWRDLDWVPDSRKVALPVNGRKNLQSALNGVFDSQISGGKRYDLAVMGRRLAHATFFESHAADSETGLTFAIDLTPLCRDEAPPIETFIVDLIDEFSEDVRARIRRFTA